jgi:hypothetical protein
MKIRKPLVLDFLQNRRKDPGSGPEEGSEEDPDLPPITPVTHRPKNR